MRIHWKRRLALGVATAWALIAAQPGWAAGHDDLVTLFRDFRAIVPPKIVDGVPDYSEPAIAQRRAALVPLYDRLRAMDDSTWPIADRVDYMLVLAEMRGMEFEARVVQPWKRDPAFYSTTDLGFGPKMSTAMALPTLPLAADKVAPFAAQLRAVPAVLAQAKLNLTDARGDLARLAIVQKKIELNVYRHMAEDAKKANPPLVKPALAAAAATADFIAWLEQRLPFMPAHGGIGKDDYNWYLHNVMLFPYDWDGMKAIAEREYQRSMSFLKIEEHRNRNAAPMPAPIASIGQFMAARGAADTEMLAWLRDQGIMTVPDWLKHDPAEGPYILPGDLDPDRADQAYPPPKPNFFQQAENRDPRPLRAHNLPGHQFDQMQAARDTRPIRGSKRLYFIDGARAEGWAFYMEELILQAGMLDDRPRAREIDYILEAKRAARVLPELMLQANRWTYAEALASLTSRAPYWMQPDDSIARFDIELYLRQPGYGIGYQMGKVELEKLLGEVGAAEGRDFDLKRFHDRFRAAGMIPISLIRWEMTGKDDEIATMR